MTTTTTAFLSKPPGSTRTSRSASLCDRILASGSGFVPFDWAHAHPDAMQKPIKEEGPLSGSLGGGGGQAQVSGAGH